MDLLPYLAAISTGNPTFDHAAKVIGLVLIACSIALNILVAVYPASKEWTWVRVAMAIFSNLHVIFTKILVKQPEPPPETPSDRPTRLEVVPPPKDPPSPPAA